MKLHHFCLKLFWSKIEKSEVKKSKKSGLVLKVESKLKLEIQK